MLIAGFFFFFFFIHPFVSLSHSHTVTVNVWTQCLGSHLLLGLGLLCCIKAMGMLLGYLLLFFFSFLFFLSHFHCSWYLITLLISPSLHLKKQQFNNLNWILNCQYFYMTVIGSKYVQTACYTIHKLRGLERVLHSF